jgi:hypothetical protein
MRFHLQRFWRSLFGAVALQVNNHSNDNVTSNPRVDVSAWLACLECMEDKASEVESLMRQTRRKRMKDSILVGGHHHQLPPSKKFPRVNEETATTVGAMDNTTTYTPAMADEIIDEENVLEELLGELLGGLLDEPQAQKMPIVDPASSFSGASVIHYQHSSSSLVSEVSMDETALTERLLADLLGDEMPSALLHCDSTQKEPSSTMSGELVPYYLSLRLLLLRAANRRSAGENDVVHTVCKSYLNYTQNKDRSQAAVCQLLVRDFQYLQSDCSSSMRGVATSVSPMPPMVAAPAGRTTSLPYQSYEMNLPVMARSNSHAAHISPMAAPQLLYLPDASSVSSFQQKEATRQFPPSF